jgi:hypothetical protein
MLVPASRAASLGLASSCGAGVRACLAVSIVFAVCAVETKERKQTKQRKENPLLSCGCVIAVHVLLHICTHTCTRAGRMLAGIHMLCFCSCRHMHSFAVSALVLVVAVAVVHGGDAVRQPRGYTMPNMTGFETPNLKTNPHLNIFIIPHTHGLIRIKNNNFDFR